MNKIIVGIVLVVSLMSIFFLDKKSGSNEFVRIHIVANSTSESDADIKYQIKEKFIEYLTPIISKVGSKKDVIDVLENNKSNLEMIANSLLLKNGFIYTATVNINNEYCPDRVYNDCHIKSGYYDALVCTLGNGQGDNWWCVLYPPLCFVNTKYVSSAKGYVYKSKLLEIINKYFK